MSNLSLFASLVMAAAELVGAGMYFFTKNGAWRKVLSAFGLGFAASIIFFDILPDATEHYTVGYAYAALGALAVLGAWFVARRMNLGTPERSVCGIAVGGMALHNFAEGVVLATLTGPLSFLFAAGVLLHKLPEGLATYSLMSGEKDSKRMAWSACVALAIPLGVLVHLPAGIQQPVMALMSGVILVAVATAIFARKSEVEVGSFLGKFAPYVAGGLIGGISCLIA